MRSLMLAVVLLATGCARVNAWQRGDLARPSMTAGFEEAPVARLYRAKVLESKTGGGLPGSAPGGGCGCTQ